MEFELKKVHLGINPFIRLYPCLGLKMDFFLHKKVHVYFQNDTHIHNIVGGGKHGGMIGACLEFQESIGNLNKNACARF